MLVPSGYCALTLVGGFLVSQLAHGLEDVGFRHNGSLLHNVSEFREMFTYWVGVLYLWELARRRGD